MKTIIIILSVSLTVGNCLNESKRVHQPKAQKLSEDRLFLTKIYLCTLQKGKRPQKAIKNAEMSQFLVYFSAFLFGGESGNKFELSPRGMKFGISLHIPDNWGRQLAAGGEGEI